jgi:hypothetical protein
VQSDLTFISPTPVSPWGTYLTQVDRVTPYLGELVRWVETLNYRRFSCKFHSTSLGLLGWKTTVTAAAA